MGEIKTKIKNKLYMKNFLLLAITVMFTRPMFAQPPIFVKSGETYIISKSESKMIIEKLTMEDNSTIVLSDDVMLWDITAFDAQFGENCKIQGVGKDGLNGDVGKHSGNQGVDCKEGLNGENGEDATPGTEGKDIKMTLGIRKIGSVVVDVQGGIGTRGGKGGNGGKGGRADCSNNCNGGIGGNGGDGGKNSDGQPGGNIEIVFWVVQNNEQPSPTPQEVKGKGFIFINNGGKGATGGKRGERGKGGEGKDCRRPIKNRSPGGPGRNGKIQPTSKSGASGTYKITPAANPVSRN